MARPASYSRKNCKAPYVVSHSNRSSYYIGWTVAKQIPILYLNKKVFLALCCHVITMGTKAPINNPNRHMSETRLPGQVWEAKLCLVAFTPLLECYRGTQQSPSSLSASCDSCLSSTCVPMLPADRMVNPGETAQSNRPRITQKRPHTATQECAQPTLEPTQTLPMISLQH